MYFSNTWYSSYLLPNSNSAFDRFGKYYDVTSILNENKTLNETAYKAYSPLYYSAGYNLVFGAYFAQYTAALVYAGLEHGTQIRDGLKHAAKKAIRPLRRGQAAGQGEDDNGPEQDVHYQLMKAYPEVQQWWFAIIAVISIILGIVMVEVYDTQMPVWGIFCCLALAFIFLVPAGIILALSVSYIFWIRWVVLIAQNIQIILVVLAEIIPGVAIPGRPYANMIVSRSVASVSYVDVVQFKIYGWIALVQALLYVQDQKLAHYLHVPPRVGRHPLFRYDP